MTRLVFRIKPGVKLAKFVSLSPMDEKTRLLTVEKWRQVIALALRAALDDRSFEKLVRQAAEASGYDVEIRLGRRAALVVYLRPKVSDNAKG